MIKKLFFLYFICIAPSYAAVIRMDLKESIEHALKANAELKVQRIQERLADTNKDIIEGEFGAKIEGLFGVAPITKAEGNAIASTETKDAWGRMVIGNLRFTKPLFAWNRKDNYIEAATLGKAVKEGDTRLKENEIRYLVKEAYYGSLFTISLLEFISDGKKDLRKVLEEGKEKKKQKKKENYRLEIFLRQVDEKEAEVKKAYDLAHAGLSLRVGMSGLDEMKPKEDWLSAQSRSLKPMEYYLELSKDSRPEFKQLKDGIEAKQLLAKAEKKALLPILGIALNYDFADTNVRPSQPGPFAYDPYNREVLSFGIGLKIDFAWDLQKAKAAKYLVEASELEAKSIYAEQGIDVEVKKAYWEVQELEKRLAATSEAYKLSKKWLSGEMIAFSAGLGSGKDLVEAYEARAESVKNYYETIFKHHMAWASLSKVVGTEVESTLQ